MREVRALLEKYGIILKILDLDSPGFYISEISTMFVSSYLNDFEAIKVILHEAGHGVLHDDLQEIYKMSEFHSKMEYEADYFMMVELVKIYIYLADIDINQFNYMQFMEQSELDLRYQDQVKQIAYEYARQELYG
ncbi:ImmA/IrrE family metallo-endopeptidase [Enterococcus avium]|uniref:ImmA/IrrE family metallo-endopeptidase n=1 Tax=Enterococcus avium TaxID=33945 RepID=UPI00288FFD1D|nr:ImmA/IrrE family metallo-endopeptidase [Enterococcus avium]MDT2493404.1 ImmA/IrrE family metallo-endopeptidase [Enterococcus avium]